MLRKNGKPRSCEPCRLSKIKCDHQTPTCIKCQSRGITDKCFYHPNPLTKFAGTPKKKPEGPRRRADARFVNLHAVGSQLAPHRTKSAVLDASVVIAPRQNGDGLCLLTPESATETTHRGLDLRKTEHSRSSIYANVFSDGQLLLDDAQALRSGTITSPPFATGNALGSRLCRMDAADTIVSMTLPFSFIEKSLHAYSYTKRASALVNPLILFALPQLRKDLVPLSFQGASRQASYTKMISNSSKPFIVPPNMLPSEFHTLFTGENLRWEILGLVLAIAGYNAQYTSPEDPIFTLSDGRRLDKDKFIEDAIHATNECITLCRAHGAVNDLTVWLIYMNFYMVGNFYGDDYQGTWQRLADCISALHATSVRCEGGVDEDGNCEPLFIREARRRTQSACYRSDKTLAAFLGRPPMFTAVYCNRKEPLNLSDEIIASDDLSIVNEAIARLDAEGWDAEGQIHPTSYIRLRGRYAVFKEQILELTLVGHHNANTILKLKSILTESQQFWDSLPKRLRYDSYDEDEAWTGSESCSIMGLILPYLEFFHVQFQALRLLNRQTQQALPELLEVSAKLLSTSLAFVKPNGQIYEAQRHFPTAVLFHCLPAAGALALELRKHTMEGISLPSTVSRSDIIRNLSVLIASLEWILLPVPGDGNHKLCIELNKMLALVLEEVLNYQPPADQGSGDVLGLADSGPEFFDMPLVDGMEPIPTETEDFLSWLDNAMWGQHCKLGSSRRVRY